MAKLIDSFVPDISVIILAHREGVIAGLSIKSLIDAKLYAESKGLKVECIAILDSPSPKTSSMFSFFTENGWKVLVTKFRDQGLARNAGVSISKASYIAFLDADDLWSFNWLFDAWQLCELERGIIIAHPEYDYFFDNNNNIFLHADQTNPCFSVAHLRLINYWDALCLAPRNAYLDYPFHKRDLEQGFAYEDWTWNCETVKAGFIHRVAENTIHFKRRKRTSQTLNASHSNALMGRNSMLIFD